jgi:hypothetical protein
VIISSRESSRRLESTIVVKINKLLYICIGKKLLEIAGDRVTLRHIKLSATTLSFFTVPAFDDGIYFHRLDRAGNRQAMARTRIFLFA